MTPFHQPFHLTCDIGGAIRVARDDGAFPILNEELQNPRILKITGYISQYKSGYNKKLVRHDS